MEVQVRSADAQVVIQGGSKSVCGGGSDSFGGVADKGAIQEGQRLADRDSDNDEGDEEREVGTGHDEEAEVRFGPEEGNADEYVEGCDTSLGSG